MTKAQSIAAQRRYQRESKERCPLCEGSGVVGTLYAQDRSRKGGRASYRKSLQPGEESMSEKGSRGGRPKALTLADLDAGKPIRRYAAPPGARVQEVSHA